MSARQGYACARAWEIHLSRPGLGTVITRAGPLSTLTLALKSLLDELPAHSDLGLELHEYTRLRADPRNEIVAEKFRSTVKEMLAVRD